MEITNKIYGDLLFVISHCTEIIVEDLESHKLDPLEKVVYDSLYNTIDNITPFYVFSRITDVVIKYASHKDDRIKNRMTEIIYYLIKFDPRKQIKKCD